MHLIKLLLIALLLSLVSGQLVRINITANSAANITDLLVVIVNIYFMLYTALSKRRIILPKFLFPYGAIFFIAAAASTILSLNTYPASDVTLAAFFLVRFILYSMLGLVIVNIVQKGEIDKFLNIFIATGFIFTLLGFLQFILFPDFSTLAAYGWDPHINRLASTTLDPNYTGGILIILVCICLSRSLYFPSLKYTLLTLFFSLAVLLTFSRSTYLAYTVSMLLISMIKSPRIIIFPIALFVASFILVPGADTRIIGALTVDETAQSRIESWRNALVIIRDRPAFGVGFNNYRNAQRQYGFFSDENSDGGHSGAGTDSSLLLILATTGIFGFAIYIAWMLSIFKITVKHLKDNYLSLALASLLVALLVHAQFVNSLLYPQILMPLVFLISLKYVRDF